MYFSLTQIPWVQLVCGFGFVSAPLHLVMVCFWFRRHYDCATNAASIVQSRLMLTRMSLTRFLIQAQIVAKRSLRLIRLLLATPNDHFFISRRQRNRLQHAINGNPSTHSEGPLAVVRKLRLQGVDEGSIRTPFWNRKGTSKSRIRQLISTRSTSIFTTTSTMRRSDADTLELQTFAKTKMVCQEHWMSRTSASAVHLYAEGKSSTSTTRQSLSRDVIVRRAAPMVRTVVPATRISDITMENIVKPDNGLECDDWKHCLVIVARRILFAVLHNGLSRPRWLTKRSLCVRLFVQPCAEEQKQIAEVKMMKLSLIAQFSQYG